VKSPLLETEARALEVEEEVEEEEDRISTISLQALPDTALDTALDATTATTLPDAPSTEESLTSMIGHLQEELEQMKSREEEGEEHGDDAPNFFGFTKVGEELEDFIDVRTFSETEEGLSGSRDFRQFSSAVQGTIF
jgi:hypothetical protein